MSFETVSLLLNWLQMGALLAILFRLASTFELIASTQRELRRAIHHLGERRSTEPGTNNAFGGRVSPWALVPPTRMRILRARLVSTMSPAFRLRSTLEHRPVRPRRYCPLRVASVPVRSASPRGARGMISEPGVFRGYGPQTWSTNMHTSGEVKNHRT
jgi:hypothetical protein